MDSSGQKSETNLDTADRVTLPFTPAIVCLEADLFVATRLDDVIRQCGGTPVLTETPDAFAQAVDRHFPVLSLLDLKTRGDWEDAIRRCKISAQTRQIPIYAFGSHVDVQTLKWARAAGADHAWANSRMMSELVQVVDRHIHPPVRYPDGWDEPISDAARRGLVEFNQRDYFEQHEFLEIAWNEESRPVRDLYQGILQIGLAFLQIERNNWSGTIKMFRRGLPKVRTLPPICRGIHLADLRTIAERIHIELTEGGPGELSNFDRTRFPRITYN